MKRLVAIGLSAAALAGCATTGPENDAPIPADKNRRPINIYPSALPDMGTQTPVGSPFASVPLTTPTVAGPMPVAPVAVAVPAAPVEAPPAVQAMPAPPPVPAPAVVPSVAPARVVPAVEGGQEATASEVIRTAPRTLPEPPPSPVYESCE